MAKPLASASKDALLRALDRTSRENDRLNAEVDSHRRDAALFAKDRKRAMLAKQEYARERRLLDEEHRKLLEKVVNQGRKEMAAEVQLRRDRESAIALLQREISKVARDPQGRMKRLDQENRMLRARLEHANHNAGGGAGTASPASDGGPASPSVSVMTVNERLTQKLNEATRKLADVGMLRKQSAALRRRLEKAEAHGPVVEALRKELSAAKSELSTQRSGNDKDAGQVSALQRKVMDAHTSHNKLKTKLQLALSNHKKVKAEMQAQSDQLKKDHHDMHLRIEGQETELKRLRRENIGLQKATEKHVGAVEVLEDQLLELEHDKELEDAALGGATAELVELKALDAKVKASLGKAEVQLGELRPQLEASNVKQAVAEATVASLTSKIATAESEGIALRNELAVLKATSRDLELSKKTSQLHATSLETQLAEAHGETDAAKVSKAELQVANNGLTMKLHVAEGKASGLSEELTSAQASIEKLAAQLGEQTGTIESLSAKLAGSSLGVSISTTDAKIADAKLTEAMTRATVAENELEGLKQNLEAYQTQLGSHTETIELLSAKLAGSSSGVLASNGDAKIADAKLAEATTRATVAENELEGLKQKLEAYQTQLGNHTETIESLNIKLASGTAQVGEDTRIAGAKIAEAISVAQLAATEIAALKAKLTEYQGLKESFELENGKLQATIGDMTAELLHQKTMLKKAKDDAPVDRTAEVAVLRAEIEALTADLETARAVVDQSAEVATLAAEAVSLKANIAALQADLTTARVGGSEEVAALTSQIAALKNEVTVCKQAASDAAAASAAADAAKEAVTSAAVAARAAAEKNEADAVAVAKAARTKAAVEARMAAAKAKVAGERVPKTARTASPRRPVKRTSTKARPSWEIKAKAAISRTYADGSGIAEVVADFDEHEADEDELPLRTGELLKVLTEVDEHTGFFEAIMLSGEHKGQVGLVSGEHVELLLEPEASVKIVALSGKPAELQTWLDEASHMGQDHHVDDGECIGIAVAMYDYAPTSQSPGAAHQEMQLKTGLLYELYGKPVDGFFMAKRHGDEGFIPLNFLALLDDDDFQSGAATVKCSVLDLDGNPQQVHKLPRNKLKE